MHTNRREVSLAFNFFYTRRTIWWEVYRALSTGIDLMTLEFTERMVLVYRFARFI